MNEMLELSNNQVIFSRAAAVFKLEHGVLTEDMIDYLRNLILKSSWKIEGKELKAMREQLGMEVNDVAASLDIKPAEIRKLENAKDFNNRDATVKYLQNFYNMRLN
jgi:DNA-binding transcriptional regulator YiaG